MTAFIVASSEPTNARTLDEYGLRFGIEETFRDEKSGGYQIHLSHLAQPEALERLLLILALATLYLTSLGVSGDQGRQASALVDPHWERRLSYVQLGWRWRRQKASRGWQAFAPFWLDPAPDPLPMLTLPQGVISTTVVDNERDDVCNGRAWPELDDGVATWTTPSGAVGTATNSGG